jgi:pseudouridine kinase
MDAVSAKKVKKLERLLPYIDYLKLNVMELQALTTEATVEDALLSPILNECNTLLITNKAFDVIVATKHKKEYYTPLQLDHVVNASGAGDAFLSGFIHGVIRKMNQTKQMEYAFKLAHLTLQHPTSAIEALAKNNLEDINE